MRNFDELKKKVESLTTASLESLLGKMRLLCSRPIAELSSFDAMERLEAIKDAAHDGRSEKANYYRLTCETLRSKLHGCSDAQFCDYRLPLQRDKDQEKIFDIMAKVEKLNRKRQDESSSRPRRDAAPGPYKSLRCYYCSKFGHTRLNCCKKKRYLDVASLSRANGQNSEAKK